MDYAALRSEIETGPLAAELAPHIASGADGEAAAILNRADISASGKVTAHDIRQYLMLVDLLLPIEASESPTCKAATRALEIFPVFDLSNPMIAYKLGQVLDGLVADNLVPDFTEEHKLTILSLANTYISRAEQAGFGVVSVEQIAQALRG
jgi:hypothetical protein